MHHPPRAVTPLAVLCLLGLLLTCCAAVASRGANRTAFPALRAEYGREVRPLLKQYCLGCHATTRKRGDLDLERFVGLEDVRRGTPVWVRVAEALDSGEMPPKGALQPLPGQRARLRAWVRRYLNAEALAGAGDPGPVVLRRLNNAEYTYTVRDLTGVELDPAREFPGDSAAGEGFTNAGNALAMSPALLAKYLDAGKEIARHMVLLPDGIRFSAHATPRDWTDELLAQIRGLYREFTDPTPLGVGVAVGNQNVHGDTRIGLAGRLPVELYLAATLAERDALRTGARTIETVAREHRLNPRYLRTLWGALTGSASSLLLDRLRSRWRAARPGDAAALAAEVAAWQKGLWMFGPVGLIGRQGSPVRWMEPVTPVVTEQELRFKIPAPAAGASGGEVVFSLVATDAGDGSAHDFVVWERPRLVAAGRPEILLRDVRAAARPSPERPGGTNPGNRPEWGLDPARFGRRPDGSPVEAASLCVRAPEAVTVRLPASLAGGYELVTGVRLDPEAGREGSAQAEVLSGVASAPSGLLPSEVAVQFSQVTQIFSDRRELRFSRPILVTANSAARTRVVAAMEEHRRLFPAALCYTQIVPVDEVLTLTLFYREDDHLARLMLDDAQKARLDRLWQALHFVSQSPVMELTVLESLLEVLAGNAQVQSGQGQAIAPLEEPFRARAARFRAEQAAAEPRQLAALIEFASRAYRRPLSAAEGSELRGLYRELRVQHVPHDEAIRATLARIFIGAPFLYRLEKAPASPAAAPVSDTELAVRLSYFLWSSQPDGELRTLADAGKLRNPAVLAGQTRRMLTDSRVRRLATEFACQWLHVHEFDALGEKSEKHFPEFAGLRGDMYEETIRFFTDLFQHDGSLLSLLDADHTFLNERLARFYGIETVRGAEWRRVGGMRRRGRGGILGLSTILAKQSGASRTSPILRGNWVSEVLLGEKLPRPPRDVPQLPAEETATAGLTVRQLVARHSQDARCAPCHQKIDPFGFALEGFDAIGRRRETDLGGRPVDTRTKLPGGREIQGLGGLRDFLSQTRREVILRQFCRKLLGYALGRGVQLSDEPLLDEMQRRLARENFRVSTAVHTIVRSRQFREIRGRSRRKMEEGRRKKEEGGNE